MMKLETMKRIDYLDEDTKQLVETMMSRWGEAQNIRFFRSSANFLFTFELSGETYFLRFNQDSERKADQIKEELAFVDYLRCEQLSVAQPIPSLGGMLVKTVSSMLGTFHATVFKALEGKQYDVDDLDKNLLFAWGKTLGQLHFLSEAYPVAARPNWRQQLEWIRGYLPQKETSAHNLARRLEKVLAALPVSEDSYGLIHFDFELDNLVWQGAKASVLDFDDCCYTWFVADVAFALRDLFDDNPDNIELSSAALSSFVSGYRSVKPLTDEQLALMPLFLRFHNLLTFTRLLRAVNNFDKANQADWLQALAEKLKRKMTTYRDGFDSTLHDV